MTQRNRLPIALAIICSFFSTTLFGDDWTYELEPYIQFTSISGDASVGRVTGADVELNFSDILETLDMAAMGHFEAHHKTGWGIALDYAFMDLAASRSNGLGGIVDASVRQGVFEALGMHRSQISNGTIDYFTGIRWWDNDISVRIDPGFIPGTIDTSNEQDWVDLIVGARWTTPINERWHFALRGDAGGLGLEADFTASLSIGARYAMTEIWTLDLQYKATWVDFESGTQGSSEYFAYNTVTHGPVVGFVYSF
jgi:hypothetical protein